MTKEEILEMLEEMRQNTINADNYNDPQRDRKRIALNVAIKAVEQQDVTYSNFINKPCSDIISREDALLCCIRGEYPLDSPQGEENARIESEIRKLPAVKPMIKTGHWILTKEDNDLPFPTKWYKCSECGKEICEPTAKFCDECGAKIIGIINEAKK